MKLSRKPELSIKYSPESLYVINVAYGYEKNNPARRAGEKNNLAPILSEKNILARTKNPSPPLNIKWTVPNHYTTAASASCSDRHKGSLIGC